MHILSDINLLRLFVICIPFSFVRKTANVDDKSHNVAVIASPSLVSAIFVDFDIFRSNNTIMCSAYYDKLVETIQLAKWRVF